MFKRCNAAMVAMNFDRRAFLAASAAAALSSRARAQAGDVLRPEDFGARGDGASNDTRAFAALSAEVNRRGGGTILLGAGRTYMIGEQLRGGGPYGWNPAPVLELRNLVRPLRILGSGARLRCQPGLRYGTFDTGRGAPVHHPMPNYRQDDIATPYRAMILIEEAGRPSRSATSNSTATSSGLPSAVPMATPAGRSPLRACGCSTTTPARPLPTC